MKKVKCHKCEKKVEVDDDFDDKKQWIKCSSCSHDFLSPDWFYGKDDHKERG